MRRSQRLNPSHPSQRAGLRAFGFLLVTVGGAFTAIGLISFFSAFGGGGMPSHFWCAFVGLPMLAFGSRLLKLAYLGTIARYIAGETAPVAGDTIDYLARQTRGGVRDLTGAIAAGLRTPADGVADRVCRKCGEPNDDDARFCDACGLPFEGPRACAQCHKVQDPAARFCDGCGAPLSA